MRRGLALPLALALTLAAAAPAALQAFGGVDADCRGRAGVVVPAFFDDRGGPLGQQVATVLNLQIWQTLRAADGLGNRFGSGIVIWSPAPPAAESFEAAELLARERGCALVFWGRAWEYGEDVVVQTYLSILEDPVLWSAEIALEGGRRTFELGFPRRRYEFAPIVLRPEVVGRFSLPSALSFENRWGGEAVLGRKTFRALRQEPNRAYVQTDDAEEGWVELPRLSDERSEVVELTGGVLRVLRGDWRGARDLLQEVVDNPAAPTSLVIDSLILQAVASERLGEDGWPMIERAYDRNSHSRITARYGLLHRVARLAERRSAGQPDEAERRALEEALADTRQLFAPEDPWVVDSRRALSR